MILLSMLSLPLRVWSRSTFNLHFFRYYRIAVTIATGGACIKYFSSGSCHNNFIALKVGKIKALLNFVDFSKWLTCFSSNSCQCNIIALEGKNKNTFEVFGLFQNIKIIFLVTTCQIRRHNRRERQPLSS